MPDPQNIDQDLALNDLVNDSIITPSVSPIPAEIARQGFAQLFGILNKVGFNPVQNLAGSRLVKSSQVLLNLIEINDFISQAALSILSLK